MIRRCVSVFWLFLVLGLVGCGSPVSSSTNGSAPSKPSSTIAAKVGAKLEPVAGEQMTPTADETETEAGTFMFDRLFAITDADPGLEIVDSGSSPGVDWYSFSDGSRLEFKSELNPDGSQFLTGWAVITQ